MSFSSHRLQEVIGVISTSSSAVVIGGGTMGAGIVELLLLTLRGGSVLLIEQDDEQAARARTRIGEAVRRRSAKAGSPMEAADSILARLRTATTPSAEIHPDIVIEAVPESRELKTAVLRACADCWPDAMLATNTSSLSVGGLAQTLPPGIRFVGMHFFNPVPRSQLVEIVTYDGCREEAVESARRWADLLGLEPIVVYDAPGFATSRLGLAIGLEAIRMVEEKVASPADIDRGMVLGYKFPIGPLELTDRIGLDVRLAIADHLSSELGSRFDPPLLLRSMVSAGELGRKSGRGFYDWTGREPMARSIRDRDRT
jgi:3-hydroxybutyryl-CoA dehydrogenase